MFGFAKPKPQQKEKKYQYKNSPHFRGTKRFNIVTYGDNESMRGLDAVAKTDIKDAVIEFKDIENGVVVYVNSHKIGAVFPHEQEELSGIEKIKNQSAEIVHIRIEKENVNGEERNKARLFIK